MTKEERRAYDEHRLSWIVEGGLWHLEAMEDALGRKLTEAELIELDREANELWAKYSC